MPSIVVEKTTQTQKGTSRCLFVYEKSFAFFMLRATFRRYVNTPWLLQRICHTLPKPCTRSYRSNTYSCCSPKTGGEKTKRTPWSSVRKASAHHFAGNTQKTSGTKAEKRAEESQKYKETNTEEGEEDSQKSEAICKKEDCEKTSSKEERGEEAALIQYQKLLKK